MAATYPRCSHGKICYPSPAKARKYARLSHERDDKHLTFYVYYHRHCGAWHLTKSAPREEPDVQVA
jgi:hypothetical protein